MTAVVQIEPPAVQAPSVANGANGGPAHSSANIKELEDYFAELEAEANAPDALDLFLQPLQKAADKANQTISAIPGVNVVKTGIGKGLDMGMHGLEKGVDMGKTILAPGMDGLKTGECKSSSQ